MSRTARRPILAGNWKLHKTIKESIELCTHLKRSLSDLRSVDIVLCAPFTAVADVAETLAETSIQTGAQDLYWEERGAFTGEVSGSLVKEAGAAYVIVGHSERRQFFHETDETVRQKAKAALRNGLVPIVCIGETLAEREKNRTLEVLSAQIAGAFADFRADEISSLVVAYEPVWAIGTGRVATPVQAGEAHEFIRSEIRKRFGNDAADALRIQYGGSVKPENISELMRQPDIDGALVGGASLDAEGFTEIVRRAAVAAEEKLTRVR